MKLFYQDKRQIDHQEVHEAVKKAYGIEHPERIQGYAGVFMFSLLDVYISDRLERLLDADPQLPAQLMEIIKRFKREDYGEAFSDEVDNNIERRYFGFSSRYMSARYETRHGLIVFEFFHDMALLYFVDEDISTIREEQEEKFNIWRLPGV